MEFLGIEGTGHTEGQLEALLSSCAGADKLSLLPSDLEWESSPANCQDSGPGRIGIGNPTKRKRVWWVPRAKVSLKLIQNWQNNRGDIPIHSDEDETSDPDSSAVPYLLPSSTSASISLSLLSSSRSSPTSTSDLD